MKKLLTAAALTLIVTSLTSCIAGPTRLYRGWDDWTNQKYTENAWLHGGVFQGILPVYPIVGGFMFLGDLAYNCVYFWGGDAWDNKGTGFDHINPTGTDKTEFAVWKD